MVKIRLMRIGGKKRPFYRVVAVDERAKRTGKFLESLGTYNPLSNPHEIILNQPRIDYWTKQGAQLSLGFLRIIGKAPQRPPAKPKKQKPPEEPKPQQTAEEPKAQIEATADQQVAPQTEKPQENPEETPAEQPALQEQPQEETQQQAQEQAEKKEGTGAEE